MYLKNSNRRPRHRQTGLHLWPIIAVLFSLSCLLSTAIAIAQEGEPAPAGTPTPTETPTPAETPLEAPTETPAEAPTETSAPTKTPAEVPTDIPAPTETPHPEPVEEPAETPTGTPTLPPTDTPSPPPTPVETTTETPTPVETPVATVTPAETLPPEASPEPSPEASPEVSPEPVEGPTVTLTPAETTVPTATLTPTAILTPTAAPDLNPTLTANKNTFIPGEQIIITGAGFAPETRYDISVLGPAGSGASGWDTLTTGANGAFIYDYQLTTLPGSYTVEVYPSETGPGSGQTPLATLSFEVVEPASLIVRLVAGLTPQEQQDVITRNGGLVTDSLPALRMYFVDVPETDLSTALQRFRADTQVLSAEADKVREVETTPSDPAYPDQWNLPQIGWPSVFNSVTPAGSSILAILDTGVDAGHPDLDGLVLPGFSVFEGGDPLADPNGHGTHLAGIAAGRTNNGLGLAGVAFSGVSLLPVQVLSQDGTGQDSDIITGIVWATDAGAGVILMAFSNPGYSPALQAAIDYAWDRNVVLVAAAGNDNASSVTYPAGDRGVMGIAATDQNDNLAPGSNYGQAIFLAAPGLDIPAPNLAGGLTTVSGTSAAAAQVAGAAAFIRAVEPALSNGVVVARLARTADPAGSREQTGNGRLNLARALADTGITSLKPAGAAPNGSGGPFIGPYIAASEASITIIKEAMPADGADFTFTLQKNPAGFISTVAGAGTSGFGGDGGAAINALLNDPRGVAFDSAGNLYIVDSSNHRIRKVTPGGLITTFAGNGIANFSGDGGPATNAALRNPYAITIDNAGNLYIADSINHRIRKVTPAGVITTFAGNGLAGFSGDNGPATGARLNTPRGVTSDSAGNIYIADTNNRRIRKVAPDGIITTVAGSGAGSFNGDNILATSASLNFPQSVVVDGAGNLYIADSGNNRIRRVNAGIITTFAGTGTAGFSGDGGAATSAALNFPAGLVFDNQGNLYFTDGNNNRIRKITPDGLISTVAGIDLTGFNGDGIPAASAALNLPQGIAFNGAGDLYLADENNHRVRRITLPLTFTLDDAAPDDNDGLGDTYVLNNLVPGAYAVSETVPAGWTLIDAACSDGSPISNIDLSAGEHIICTFTNAKAQSTGSITIIKDAVPDTPQDFQFGGDLGAFILDDDTDNTLPDAKTFTNLTPGPYTITEDTMAGWNLSSRTCTDPDGGTANHAGNGILIDLDPGENITCTFTNTLQAGRIVVDKVTLPAGDTTSFDFQAGGGSYTDFSLSDPAAPNNQELAPGTYSVAETVPPGWTLTGATCDGGNTPANISLQAGQTVTCTFTNTKLSAIVVKKDVVPAHAQDFAFTASGPGLSGFTLDDDTGTAGEDNTFAETISFSNLTPGAYIITETLPVAGFDLAALTCTDPSGGTTTDLDIGQATISLAAGETVICTYTSTQRGTVIINKTAVGGDGTFNYTATGADLPANFNLGTSSGSALLVAGNVRPGAKTVAESLSSAGWALIDLACNDPDNGTAVDLLNRQANIDLDPGETVSCNFTNTRQNPELSLETIASPTTYDEVSDIINYSYILTNTGNVIIDGPFTITDDKTTDEACPNTASMAPGDTITCTASHIITQADLDNGSFTNTAQGHASFDNQTVNSNQASETVDAIQNPELTLEKIASPMTYDQVGDTISYEYEVTNTGNVTLAGPITVADDKATVTCPALTTIGNFDSNLQPDEVIICTASYIITQDDLDNGSVTNTAQASADGVESNEAAETVNAIQNPKLSLEKIADPTTYDEVGEIINYSYILTNTGNVTLDGPFTVTDDKATDESCPAITGLTPGDTITCTASHTTTQADLDNSALTNTATGQGSFEGNPVTSNQDSETVTAFQNPELTLEKIATPTTYDEIGDVINYSYLLTNTGNVTLDGPFTITDDKTDDEACPSRASLAPGEMITCAASYTIAQEDLDNGSVTNLATGQANFDGNLVTSNQDTETVATTQSPELTLEKIASPTIYDKVGDVINYSYILTNTGNVTLDGPFTVTDDKASNEACPATVILSPDDAITCTASDTITQAALDDGSLTNTAQGHASFNNKAVNSNEDSETVTAIQNPELTLEKVASPTTYEEIGDVINYSYVLTNTGNVTLNGPFIVIDDKVTDEACPDTTTLAPGDTITCTASHTITQADLNNGSLTNLATGYASFDGSPVLSNEDSKTVEAIQNLELTLEKIATPTTYDEVGDTISYIYVLTNTGNVTLAGPVTVADDKATVTCPALTTIGNFDSGLQPDEVIICAASYIITQDDLDNGSLTNTAQGHAFFNNQVVNSNEDSKTVDASQNPDLVLEQMTNSTTYDEVGDVINYNYILTNTGNVTLDGPFTVTDDKANDENCPATASLAPGDTITCTASYTISQEDLDNGSLTNLAIGGASFDDNTITSNKVSETVDAIQNPELTLEKLATPATYDEVGDIINYTYILTNTGNVTLDGPLTVTDDKASNESCPTTNSLAPGDTITCTASYTIAQGDLDNGSVTNRAISRGNFDGNSVTSNQDTETVNAIQNPELSLEMVTDSTTYDEVGAVINYSYVLTNTGNVTLDGPFTVTDDKAHDENCPATASLAPGGTLACTASHTITQADLDNGSLTNTAQGHANFKNQAVHSNQDSETVTAPRNPELTLEKIASPTAYDEVGDVINYSYVLTNTGNVTLDGPFTITDNKADDEACPDTTTLLPGTSITCTASYAITQADLDNGSVTNLATGRGSFDGDPVTSSQDSETVDAIQNPKLTLEKVASPAIYDEVGDVINYSYILTNTGNVTLDGPFIVADDKTSDETCPVTASLAPGASITCTAAYTITSADLNNGSLTNTAQASASFDNTPVTSNQATETVEAVQRPAIAVDQQGPLIIPAGQAIPYTYTVTNPGNVPLSNIFISDNNCGPATYLAGDTNNNKQLDRGESWRFTCSHTPNFNTHFPNKPLKSIVTAKGRYQKQQVSAQADDTLYPYLLRKKIYLYWGSVLYPLPDNTRFTVEARRNNNLVGTYPLSQNTPQRLWLSEGAYLFKEINLPPGYLPGYHAVGYTTGQGYPDWTLPTALTFDLALSKSGPATARKGSAITYKYKVTNTGPASVKPRVTDNNCSPVTYLSGDTDKDGRLDPGETWTFKCNYKVTQKPNTLLTTRATVADTQRPSQGWFLGGDWNSSNNSSPWTLKIIK